MQTFGDFWIYLHNAPLFTEQSWLSIYHFDA
jgi:hypothetical protein